MVATGCQNAHAGLYSPDEPCRFKIEPDGTAAELSYATDRSGVFPLEMAILGNIGDPRRTTPERTTVLKRLESNGNIVSRSADLIRTRQYDAALNLLAPQARRNPDYRVLANLAHLYAQRGGWEEAILRHEAVLEDTTMPDDLAGTTPEQRRWLARVEKDYYHRWLKLHAEEKAQKIAPQDEEVFALFAEQKPRDAIAIVQQLLLWSPDDNRLYWLLGELYADSGRLVQAQQIFDSLASEGRQQSNRTRMMERRTEVRRAVAALPPEAPVELIIAPPDTRTWFEKLGLDLTRLIAGAVVFAVIAMVLLYFQIRRWVRRRS